MVDGFYGQWLLRSQWEWCVLSDKIRALLYFRQIWLYLIEKARLSIKRGFFKNP
jgi:hypothetical protein